MARKTYGTLDGLRGLAALAVLLFHLPGPPHALGSHGYLAVDLFFLLSGFVVAKAYEDRLVAGWGAGRFLIVRLKRLWPVYALGVSLGVSVFAFVRTARPDLPFALPQAGIETAILAGLAFVPQIIAYGGPAFPFNAASWSLSVELFGNLFYAAIAKALRPAMLALLIAAGALALALVAARKGDLDVGVLPGNLLGGYARFLFSFFLGVALWRLIASGNLKAPRVPLVLPFAAAAFAFSGAGDGAVRDLFTVVALFPAVMIAALHEPASPRTARIFAWMGRVSYPLYIVHPPLVVLVDALAGPDVPLWLAVATAAGAVLLAALVDKAFDRPVQALLRGAVPPTAISAQVRAD